MGLDDKIKNAAQDIAGKAKEALGEHAMTRTFAARAKPTSAKRTSRRPARTSRTCSS